MQRAKGKDEGFSLIELLVVMIVTFFVSGAIYGLLSSGQSAFRREPEMSDRQQNIRVGSSLVESDILGAGAYMPLYAQTFTNGLDGVGPTGTSGAATDELEIFTSGNCDILNICNFNPGASFTTFEGLSSCFGFPALILLANDVEWGVYWASQPGAGSVSSCSGGGSDNGHVQFAPGQAPLINPAGGPNFVDPPEIMSTITAARYRIQVDAEGVPNLWRSAAGGRTDPVTGASTWQMVARGVEDLQVRYETGAGWANTPGVVTSPDLNSIVRRVEVTLWSRTIAPSLAGESARTGLTNAIRGRLVTTGMPRAAFTGLQISGQIN